MYCQRNCIKLEKILFALGDTKAAKAILVKLVTKYPNSYYAHKLLAQIYESEEKYEEAIDEYVKAIEINTKDYDSYYQIAFLLNKNSKQEEAEEMLEDLLAKKPEYYKASELLGTILYDQEKFKQAVSVYLEALKYNPTRYELYYELGERLTKLESYIPIIQIDVDSALEMAETMNEHKKELFLGRQYMNLLSDLEKAGIIKLKDKDINKNE